MKIFLLLITLMTLYACGTSSTAVNTTSESWDNPPEFCSIQDSSDWENVHVHLIEEYKPPRWLRLDGEAIFNLDASVTTLENVPPDLMNEMKQRAAKAGGCILFVDLKDFYGDEQFPVRKKNRVYFYWGVPK